MLSAWNPDLVVACFGYNDHHSAVESDAEKYARRRLHAVLGPVQKTALFRLVHRLAGRSDATLKDAPVPRVDLDEFRDNILQIRQMAASDGSECLLTP